MSQAAAKMIANSDLDGVTLKVLWRLIAELDMENYLYINQSEIAAEMGLNKPNISRAIRDLIKEGIIIEGLRVGRSKTYRLDPYYGWKGSTKNHVVAIEDHVKKKITRKSSAATKNISIVPDK
jgi:DNA-binding transcriptional ArsR family regulator